MFEILIFLLSAYALVFLFVAPWPVLLWGLLGGVIGGIAGSSVGIASSGDAANAAGFLAVAGFVICGTIAHISNLTKRLRLLRTGYDEDDLNRPSLLNLIDDHIDSIIYGVLVVPMFLFYCVRGLLWNKWTLGAVGIIVLIVSVSWFATSDMIETTETQSDQSVSEPPDKKTDRKIDTPKNPLTYGDVVRWTD